MAPFDFQKVYAAAKARGWECPSQVACDGHTDYREFNDPCRKNRVYSAKFLAPPVIDGLVLRVGCKRDKDSGGTVSKVEAIVLGKIAVQTSTRIDESYQFYKDVPGDFKQDEVETAFFELAHAEDAWSQWLKRQSQWPVSDGRMRE